NQASVEPQHPARARPRERLAEAPGGLHRLHQGGQGHQGRAPGAHRRLTSAAVQGAIKSYDPGTGAGVVVTDTHLNEYDLAAVAPAGWVLRMLRQGQRVVFHLDDAGRATALRLGSEIDMHTPTSR